MSESIHRTEPQTTPESEAAIATVFAGVVDYYINNPHILTDEHSQDPFLEHAVGDTVSLTPEEIRQLRQNAKDQAIHQIFKPKISKPHNLN